MNPIAPNPSKTNALNRIKNHVALSCVVDVGVRECTQDLINVFPALKHFLFEPVQLFFDSIERNYRNVAHELYPIALAHVTSNYYLVLTSLHKNGIVTHSKIALEPVVVDGMQTVSCQPIEAKRFDELDLAITIEDNFLLKIDVDGQDLNVAKGFGEKLRQASVVIIECTYLTAIERFAYLQSKGFELIDLVDLVYYGPSLYQFDAVFARKDLTNSELRPPIANFKRDLWSPVVFSNYSG